MSRVETGPVRIDDDWKGLFIRGDTALGLSVTLQQVLVLIPDENWLAKAQLQDAIELLASVDEHNDIEPVLLTIKEDTE